MGFVDNQSFLENIVNIILINPRINNAYVVSGRTIHVENNLRCIFAIKRGDVIVLESYEHLLVRIR